MGSRVLDHFRAVRPAGSVYRRICRSWWCLLNTRKRMANQFHLRELTIRMYDGGCFGGFTRWAVVFLIIFVLFILLVPFTGGYAGAGY
jgi:hypothetical protein